MIKKILTPGLAVVVLAAASLVPLALDAGSSATAAKGTIGINVLLNTKVSEAIVAELGNYGKVRDVLLQVNALTMQAKADRLPAIQALPYVAAANPDAERTGSPIDTVAATNFANGLSTWNLDAINVTDLGPAGSSTMTGRGFTWLSWTPASWHLAPVFAGGAHCRRVCHVLRRRRGRYGHRSSQPKKWGLDVNSHGTHVTSTILGYALGVTPINGVAPKATVIPVKVLNQTGSGWSSVIARGIEYVGDLKAGPLAGYPVVINMSLSGPVLDAVEQAAIDYAIEQGVIIVASAGNRGTAGMGYPGAYAPVISVAASGWVGEWPAGSRQSGGGAGTWPIRRVRPISTSWISRAAPRPARTSTSPRPAHGSLGPTSTKWAKRAITSWAAPPWPAPMWPARWR